MPNAKAGRFWIFVLVSSLVAWGMVPAVQSFGAPIAGGPGFISIGAFEFKPYSPSIAYDYTGGRLYNKATTTEVFLAPVHLPHGAIVTQVVLYYVDNGPSDIRVYLWATPLDSPSAEIKLADMTTSGASADPRTLIINNFPNGNGIDNRSNAYTVSLDLPSGSSYRIGGARIDYAFPINLPAVTK
jgi:hypothetical protein